MAFVFYDEDVRQNTGVNRREKLEAVLKLISLFGFAVVLGGVLLFRRLTQGDGVGGSVSRRTLGRIEHSTPYKTVLYDTFGFVAEPKLTLPLKTIRGYEETTFLLDSGAVVSALPLQAAHDTGVDLAKAKRIVLQGFSGVPSFAYLDSIILQIAEKDFTFPAVFTESNKTTYILGRKGFFDDFTIQFNNESKLVTISTRN